MPRAKNITTVVDNHAKIGESPIWVAEECALYWIDIKEPALHRLLVSTGRHRAWLVTSDIGGFALTRAGGALLAMREGIFHLDLATSALERLAPPPFDPMLFRFNEGACDPSGRFWIGVMFDPLESGSVPQKGFLHSFTFEQGLHLEPDATELHNGMAWSADGRRFYISHSYSRMIYVHDYDVVTGRFGARRLFATVPNMDGIPDGAAVDEDDGYWCALHGGSRLRRYRSDGSRDFDVELPVSQPTMCAFGGADRKTIYVTSASEKTERATEPLAGNLLALESNHIGVARQPYVR